MSSHKTAILNRQGGAAQTMMLIKTTMASNIFMPKKLIGQEGKGQ